MNRTDNINKKLKILLLIFLVLFTGRMVKAQFTPISKKVHEINTVDIVRNRSQFYGEDQKMTLIDTTLMQTNSSVNLDELLSVSTSLYIKNYGAGGSLAVPSLRGSTSNHTSLTWNGFPINSITLGQCDLSLSPMEFMDEVSITHGASGSLYGNGTFGGNIDLKNNIQWTKKDNISLSSELGSWNNQRYNVQSLIGNKKIKYRINGFFQTADNDFTYNDTQKFGNPLETRDHNGLINYGVMQNVFFKPTKRNSLEAGLWFQEREKNIPGLMGEYGSGTSTQKDSTLRAYVKWKKVFSESSLQAKSGYFYKYQLYTEKENPEDESYSLYSPITTKKWLNDLNYRHYYSEHITFDVGTQYSLLNASANGYENNDLTEYRASLIGAAKVKYPGITTNVSIRQQFNNYTKPKPQFSVGGQYQLIQKTLYFRGNFSTKYRIPTFNDKYWNPGGNKDIKPEHGWSGEFGLQYSNIKDPATRMTAEITGYTSKINDLIQWVPKNGATYWHAINTSKVHIMGIESSFNLLMNILSFRVQSKFMYNYTRSMKIDKDNPSVDEKILRYSPLHTLKNYTNIDYNKYSFGTSFKYIGEQYTTEDNSMKLPGFFTTDIYLNRAINFNNIKGEIQLSVKNLFDEEYQVIANYPMPGRAYFIKLNVEIQNLFKN